MKSENPPISITDQIELLKRRGMEVDDEAIATHHLEFISYCRLEDYWSIFEASEDNENCRAFREGTAFNDVLEVYNFDRELRLLVLDAIERVEVAFRARWVHHVAVNYGSHGYLDRDLYRNQGWYTKNIPELRKQFRRSKDSSVGYRRNKRDDSELPPIWTVAEIISFGLLSKMINDLRRADRKSISHPFGLKDQAFASISQHLSHVRNICAHHSRLWNKRFTVTMGVGCMPDSLKADMHGADNRRLHNTLVALDHLLSIIAPETEWRKRVNSLIDSNDLVTPSDMGFPDLSARAAPNAGGSVQLRSL